MLMINLLLEIRRHRQERFFTGQIFSNGQIIENMGLGHIDHAPPERGSGE
jgi:hypothetical protein